jgi:hypothetical protein
MFKKIIQASAVLVLACISLFSFIVKAMDKNDYENFVKSRHIRSQYGHSNASIFDAVSDYILDRNCCEGRYGGQHHCSWNEASCKKCFTDFDPNHKKKKHHEQKRENKIYKQHSEKK